MADQKVRRLFDWLDHTSTPRTGKPLRPQQEWVGDEKQDNKKGRQHTMATYEPDIIPNLNGDLIVRGFTDATEAVAYLAKQDPEIEAPVEKGELGWLRVVPVRHPWKDNESCGEYDHNPCTCDTALRACEPGSRGAFPVITWWSGTWRYKNAA